ncbi:hypothetical protein ANN_00202 [Periplaneta americana]|uniref:C2H2-type domain-containing protein n=1 Tax=Periplaneta americana TaxID=6978 RepID=A0ABQ8TQ42_PERAM|nr:hypothetical protein ANN_00202 [Periplaneta americana]
MEGIKKEVEMEPLDPQFDDGSGEEEKNMSTEEISLNVDGSGIKVELLEPISGLASDLKYEESEVSPIFPTVKSEIQEQCWQVDTIKDEVMTDTMKEDVELADRSMQQHQNGDFRSHDESDACENPEHPSDMVVDRETHSMNIHPGVEIRDETVTIFKCEFCTKDFLTSQLLTRHSLTHIGDKPFKCDICEMSFRQRHHLIRHNLTHTGDKPFKCDKCEKTFARLDYLTHHALLHTGFKAFKCDICDKGFNTRRDIDGHIAVHKGERPFKCNICQKSFVRRRQCRQHEETHIHDKTFKCGTCEKSFTRLDYLRQHELCHTDNKSFKCETCDKSFATLRYLRQHASTHTKDKCYRCETCDKTYVRLEHLRLHILSHTGDKPYKCQSCEKSFVRQDYLLRHILIHTGDKPYKCETCEKGFGRLSHLQQHLLIHTRDKPFKCETCEKSFARRGSLRQHILTHTRDKIFKCENCEKSFVRLDSLRNHALTHAAVDMIKMEPDTDPLAPEHNDTNAEDRETLSEEGNFLEVNVNEIKIEPSDLDYDDALDVKCEDKEDCKPFPAMAFEDEVATCKCGHQCRSLTMEDNKILFYKFYQMDYNEQTHHLAHECVELVDIRRRSIPEETSRRHCSFKYFVRVHAVPCQEDTRGHEKNDAR